MHLSSRMDLMPAAALLLLLRNNLKLKKKWKLTTKKINRFFLLKCSSRLLLLLRLFIYHSQVLFSPRSQFDQTDFEKFLAEKSSWQNWKFNVDNASMSVWIHAAFLHRHSTSTFKQNSKSCIKCQNMFGNFWPEKFAKIIQREEHKFWQESYLL